MSLCILVKAVIAAGDWGVEMKGEDRKIPKNLK